MAAHVDATRYMLIIEWSDEDAAYIATAPELPGCRTHGGTRAEAVRKGEEAIESWLESAAADGWAPPPPRLFDGWSNIPAATRTMAPHATPALASGVEGTC